MVSVLGNAWWQIRGWPVNLFLQLDPLVGMGTLLSTGTIYAGLLWSVLTVVLTILLGRFFCGWVCPFGALHQLTGFLANRNQSAAQMVKRNRYHHAQSLKYIFLIVFLTSPVLSLIFNNTHLGAASLQTGLLDPLPLIHRSVNLILVPLISDMSPTFLAAHRYYDQAWSVGVIFLIAVLMNIVIPRFYCRFICPLGALLGIFSRFALVRIGKKPQGECTHCHLCERYCEGACEPSDRLRLSECVLCMNCRRRCPSDLIGYGASLSFSDEISAPDLSRREIIVSLAAGVTAIPMMRLDGMVGPNWNASLIRPPGALPETEFLSRCIKCGQCMRICPTNVIHLSGLHDGIESLWTPVLNFRIGTSGCQRTCIACGHVCPTAAIRPLTVEERLGVREYQPAGPIRIGTAFVDQSRCLPWAMDKPCIVCQENCPVSPKAITTKEILVSVVPQLRLIVKQADNRSIELEGNPLPPARFSTGDFRFLIRGQPESVFVIETNTQNTLSVSPPMPQPLEPGTLVDIQIRLQRPFVNPERCIGCGVCEHECPIKGMRGIRITAENESRHKEHALWLQSVN